jgi:muramoyltetrapeptide carboxypeptidase
MVKPRALRPGDRLAVVSPASPFNREDFDRGLAEIRALGFEPVHDESVFARTSYVSGPPELRARAIHNAWRDASIAGVVAARGGYGSAQVLPLLDRDAARRARKPFIGYSDITSLLMFLTLGCGVVSFHGPMIDRRLSRGAAGYDRTSFLRALTRAEPVGELTDPGVESIRSGESTGMLLGGTLTQLLASLGTPLRRRPAMCCFSMKWGSGRTDSTGPSRNSVRLDFSRRHPRSSSVSCRTATSRRASRPGAPSWPASSPIFQVPC